MLYLPNTLPNTAQCSRFLVNSSTNHALKSCESYLVTVVWGHFSHEYGNLRSELFKLDYNIPLTASVSPTGAPLGLSFELGLTMSAFLQDRRRAIITDRRMCIPHGRRGHHGRHWSLLERQCWQQASFVPKRKLSIDRLQTRQRASLLTSQSSLLARRCDWMGQINRYATAMLNLSKQHLVTWFLWFPRSFPRVWPDRGHPQVHSKLQRSLLLSRLRSLQQKRRWPWQRPKVAHIAVFFHFLWHQVQHDQSRDAQVNIRRHCLHGQDQVWRHSSRPRFPQHQSQLHQVSLSRSTFKDPCSWPVGLSLFMVISELLAEWPRAISFASIWAICWTGQSNATKNVTRLRRWEPRSWRAWEPIFGKICTTWAHTARMFRSLSRATIVRRNTSTILKRWNAGRKLSCCDVIRLAIKHYQKSIPQYKWDRSYLLWTQVDRQTASSRTFTKPPKRCNKQYIHSVAMLCCGAQCNQPFNFVKQFRLDFKTTSFFQSFQLFNSRLVFHLLLSFLSVFVFWNKKIKQDVEILRKNTSTLFWV